MANKVGLANLARHIFVDCEPANEEPKVSTLKDFRALTEDGKKIILLDELDVLPVHAFTAMWKHEYEHQKMLERMESRKEWNLAADMAINEALKDRFPKGPTGNDAWDHLTKRVWSL